MIFGRRKAEFDDLGRKFTCNKARFGLDYVSLENGGVAKRPKATVCKTVIRGFESHRRLSFLYILWEPLTIHFGGQGNLFYFFCIRQNRFIL